MWIFDYKLQSLLTLTIGYNNFLSYENIEGFLLGKHYDIEPLIIGDFFKFYGYISKISASYSFFKTKSRLGSKDVLF